ncbi:MAG: alpha-D-ribose 1-methylphosphonate 5-triphosphate diphosphatase [Pseudomonadota bacterium]
MVELALSNCEVVCGAETFRGHVVLRHGLIEAVGQGPASTPGAVDCEGDFVCPGLIELHTDNLERHIQPRPTAQWPHTPAVMAHDAELASCGITTVFDAVRAGTLSYPGYDTGYRAYARDLTTEILDLVDAHVLKISHFIHLRAEICSQTLSDELDAFGISDRVRLVSIMDHTPGQRQFTDVSKFEFYARAAMGLNEQEFAQYVAFLEDLRESVGETHIAAAVEHAKAWGATLASHDDTTAGQVVASAELGVEVAEFPTTLAAAQACFEAKIAVMMGAPNLVRGGSHSGNVAAMDLAKADRLDIVSSDYVPSALLLAAVRLGREWQDMARGLATVTSAPARALGLDDRGVLEPGKRADVLRFRTLDDGTPVIRGVWAKGRQVA